MSDPKRRKRSAHALMSPVQGAVNQSTNPSKSPKLSASPAMKPSSAPSQNEQSVTASTTPSDKPTHRVHRCRFFPYQPSAICALSFNQSGSMLALARTNGNIEIWSTPTLSISQSINQSNHKKEWFCTKTIAGTGEQSVNQLMWSVDENSADRLFSVGLNGRLIEWDLDRLIVRHYADSHGGPIWNSAVKTGFSLYKQLFTQHRSNDQSNKQAMNDDSDDEDSTINDGTIKHSASDASIVCACEDGTLRLFDVSDSTQAPVYIKALIGHKDRVLTCAWMDDQSAKQTNSNNIKQAIVSGGLDGSVRCWDIEAGRNVQRISVGDKLTVWSVCVVNQPNDQSIVVGDSTGTVSWFDSRFGVLKQSFHSHRGDVLSVNQSLDHSILSVGMDGLMCEYRLSDQKYVLTANHRAHTHDILALAVQPTNSSNNQTVSPSMISVTGGVDTQLIINQRSLTPTGSKFRSSKILPINQSMISTNQTHFLAHQNRTLSLFKLGSVDTTQSVDPSAHEPLPLASSYEHLVDFQLARSDSEANQQSSDWDTIDCLNITCSALSNDSRWIACSDPMFIRLYEVTYKGDELQSIKKQTFAQSSKNSLKPANALSFTPDSSHLIVATNAGSVQILNLSNMTNVHSISLERENPGVWRSISFSVNQSMFAVGDDNNNIFVISWPALTTISKLPVMTSPFTALAFHQSINQSNLLMVTTSDNHFHVFDALTGQFTEWSKKTSENMPQVLTQKNERILSISSDASTNKVLLTSPSWMCVVDIGQVVAPSLFDGLNYKKRRDLIKKSKTQPELEQSIKAQNFRMINKYRPLLFGGFINQFVNQASQKSKKSKSNQSTQPLSDMLVIEAPWLKVLEALPAPMSRKKYGT